MDVFIGNLPLELDDEGLKKIVEPYAKVSRSKIVRDKLGGESKGYGFVTVPDEEANKAISQLKGQSIEDKVLYIRKSQEKKRLPERFFMPREWREKAAEKG